MKPQQILLGELITRVRVADLLDIALIATLVYGIVLWVRRANSRFVLLGLGTLTCLYVAARVLGMYMTLFVFQLGFTVFLVALIVIFQEDIRRAFERVPLVGPFNIQQRQHDALDIIVESAVNLAATRCGALIVIKGKEPLDRHLMGGIEIGGQISTSLLYSIFDHHSPGHDGAVVVDQGRVSKFGVRLPLSTSENTGRFFGTRHTAALGLAERSDALVLAISEERGSISAAENGKISVVAGEAELRARIEGFLAKITPRRSEGSVWRKTTRNAYLKAISITIATGAWLFMVVQARESAERTFIVPVVYHNLPERWLLDEPDPLEARVTVAGPLVVLERVKPDDLTLRVDVSRIHRGTQKIPLGKQNISPPPGLSVQIVEPNAVRVTAYSKAQLELPIKPKFRGRLPDGVKLQSVETIPSKVRVLVTETDRSKITSVSSGAIDLSEVTSSRAVNANLVLPAGIRLAEGEPYQILIQLEVAERKPAPDK
jgi:diadenylate cyclase